jgi:hypothetical protein
MSIKPFSFFYLFFVFLFSLLLFFHFSLTFFSFFLLFPLALSLSYPSRTARLTPPGLQLPTDAVHLPRARAVDCRP